MDSFQIKPFEVYTCIFRSLKELPSTVEKVFKKIDEIHPVIFVNIYLFELLEKNDCFDISNFPRKMFYSAMSAEILRVCKALTKFHDFMKSAKILIDKIIKQGGLISHTKKALLKLFIVMKNVSLNSEKLMIIF